MSTRSIPVTLGRALPSPDPSACDHGHAPDACTVTGCTNARRLSRCAEPDCNETPSGGRHRNGGHACIRHTDPKSLLAPPKVGESPRALAGTISPRVMIGRDESGKTPAGAEDWYYREPRAAPDAHHTDAIVVNGRLMFQQAPPVHSRTVAPGSPSVHKTVARELSETEAQRRYLGATLTMLAEGVAGSTEDIAATLGWNKAKLARKKPRGRK